MGGQVSVQARGTKSPPPVTSLSRRGEDHLVDPLRDPLAKGKGTSKPDWKNYKTGPSWEGDDEEVAPDRVVPGEGFTEASGVKAGDDYRDDTLEDQRPTGYTITVIMARENKYNALFNELRMGSKIRNTAREYIKGGWLRKLVRKPKTSRKMKERAFTKTYDRVAKLLSKKSKGNKEQYLEQAKAEVGKVNDEIGHAWVQLTAHVGKKPKEVSSFGFYPDEKIRSATKPQAGVVLYPDRDSLGVKGKEIKAKDTHVSAAKYGRAFALAAARKKGPPAYKLGGYNCTAFAREIAKAGGASFPSARLEPIDVPWFLKRFTPEVLSPTKGFESLEEDKGAYDFRAKAKEIDEFNQDKSAQEEQARLQEEEEKRQREEERQRQAEEAKKLTLWDAYKEIEFKKIDYGWVDLLDEMGSQYSGGDWLDMELHDPSGQDYEVRVKKDEYATWLEAAQG